jgi:hypothetical protein
LKNVGRDYISETQERLMSLSNVDLGTDFPKVMRVFQTWKIKPLFPIETIVELERNLEIAAGLKNQPEKAPNRNAIQPQSTRILSQQNSMQPVPVLRGLQSIHTMMPVLPNTPTSTMVI